MDTVKLSELLFPHIQKLPADVEAEFPARNLPEGAKVTRLAPSPTGFMHFGTLFPALVNERLAHQSGGVFFLRIEDTDAKREVKGAEKDLIDTLRSLPSESSCGNLSDFCKAAGSGRQSISLLYHRRRAGSIGSGRQEGRDQKQGLARRYFRTEGRDA